MPHKRKNGQMCNGRPYQEGGTLTIKCASCRETVGPPPNANKKAVTIQASADGVNELLRRRLHPEEKVKANPYAEAKVGSHADAFSLIQQKAAQRAAEEAAKLAGEPGGVAVMDAPALPLDADLLTAGEGDEPMASPILPDSPSADIVTQPLDSTPPLLAALQQAREDGDAAKAEMPPPRAGRRR